LNVKIKEKKVFVHFFSYISTMGFREQQAAIQKELDRFVDLLEVLLPRYSTLLKKEHLSEMELNELGEIEHFLIGVSGRITAIKHLLEQDVFGHSLHQYYKEKRKADSGDPFAAEKLKQLKKTFSDALDSGSIVNWN